MQAMIVRACGLPAMPTRFRTVEPVAMSARGSKTRFTGSKTLS
ncbi:Uncharacterised protein [Mycobacterium tuberculosis]|nr:Uncharacterised protein [Mycobacterium tuberculosis]